MPISYSVETSGLSAEKKNVSPITAMFIIVNCIPHVQFLNRLLCIYLISNSFLKISTIKTKQKNLYKLVVPNQTFSRSQMRANSADQIRFKRRAIVVSNSFETKDNSAASFDPIESDTTIAQRLKRA